jgi:hypothetical protein
MLNIGHSDENITLQIFVGVALDYFLGQIFNNGTEGNS